MLRNFTCGGDWILQDALTNSAFLSELLPPGIPLSTLRIVTASRRSLATSRHSVAAEGRPQKQSKAGPVAQPLPAPAAGPEFSVLTAVLRAGRVGALTDHDCVCFPVDPGTGELAEGRSNQVLFGPRGIAKGPQKGVPSVTLTTFALEQRALGFKVSVTPSGAAVLLAAMNLTLLLI